MLQTIEDYLADHSLIDGYLLRWYRWYDSDLSETNDPFMVLKQDGGGEVNVWVARPFFRIQLVGRKSQDPREISGHIELIRDTLLTDHKTGEIIQFQVLSDIIGPTFIENDRPVFELGFTALTTRNNEI